MSKKYKIEPIEQTESNLCWATVLQMMFNYMGVNVSNCDPNKKDFQKKFASHALKSERYNKKIDIYEDERVGSFFKKVVYEILDSEEQDITIEDIKKYINKGYFLIALRKSHFVIISGYNNDNVFVVEPKPIRLESLTTDVLKITANELGVLKKEKLKRDIIKILEPYRGKIEKFETEEDFDEFKDGLSGIYVIDEKLVKKEIGNNNVFPLE